MNVEICADVCYMGLQDPLTFIFTAQPEHHTNVYVAQVRKKRVDLSLIFFYFKKAET